MPGTRFRTAGALAATFGMALAACGGTASTPPAPSGSPAGPSCRGGQDCVNVVVTGAISGTLKTAAPPTGFRPICTKTVSPTSSQQWVSHTYGTLNSLTWSLSVQTTTYDKPAKSYPAFVTLSQTTNTSGATPAVYYGPGTADVAADQASATIDATLKLVRGTGQSVSVRGSTSCSEFTPTR